jgi:disulfide bond formation protein DsbB
MTNRVATEQDPRQAIAGTAWTWAAAAVSLAAVAGSLYLSLGMGLRACPLCFYQRSFAMSLLAVLGVGLLAGGGGQGRLSLLALPLAAAGLGVAMFHVYLELAGRLECPAGVLGLGTAPKQSLTAFVIVFVLLAADALRGSGAGGGRVLATASAVVLGGLLALGCCTSNPPPPPAPTAPYAAPPDICRPPYTP